MTEFFRNLGERLSKWNVILGLILLIAGFLVTVFAGKIAHAAAKKTEDEIRRKEKEAAVRLIVQIAGLVTTVVGFIIAMVIPF